MTSGGTRDEPQYIQIAAAIRNKIKLGELRPGDPIPSASRICAEYNVSMITAKNALTLLKNEGAVYGIAGKRTYVADNTRIVRTAPDRYFRGGYRTHIQDTERSGVSPRVEHETEIIPATKWIAQRLEINEHDMVSETIYRLFIDDHLISMSKSWEPLSITGGTPIELPHEGKYGDDGLNTRFSAIGWQIQQLDERLFVREPEKSEKAALNLPPNVSVVELRQTVRASQSDEDDLVPIEAADVVYSANRYEFHYIIDRPH